MGHPLISPSEIQYKFDSVSFRKWQFCCYIKVCISKSFEYHVPKLMDVGIKIWQILKCSADDVNSHLNRFCNGVFCKLLWNANQISHCPNWKCWIWTHNLNLYLRCNYNRHAFHKIFEKNAENKVERKIKVPKLWIL